MLSLAVDAALLILLLIALGVGLRLQRSLGRLRCEDNEVTRLIDALDAASGRAATALDGLRGTADAVGERVAADLAGAQRLLDELQFMTSRGDQLADRLDEQIQQGRAAVRPAASRAVAASPPTAAAQAPDRTGDLARALRTLR